MRAVGGGSKKLTVAFHFQFANQAGWECDECRRAGLEMRRRCGWKAEAQAMPARVVWARKEVGCEECPSSYITAQSVAWVERFLVWKRLGFGDDGDMTARDVEAFLILEREWGQRGGASGN